MMRIDSAGATLGLVVGGSLAQLVHVGYVAITWATRPDLGIWDAEVATMVVMAVGAVAGLAAALIAGPVLYFAPRLRRPLSAVFVLGGGAAIATALLLALRPDFVIDGRGYVILLLSTVVIAAPVGLATTAVRDALARRDEARLRAAMAPRSDDELDYGID
ncbi:MAG: hypothetical protein J0H23_00055 [Micrococcales bacterium]|nr:hypothetical protein [Micrococcales bacterium]OJX66877.1 MAG: hypothetical protein BGO94_08620 [Micrococcales bacterium 72-143]